MMEPGKGVVDAAEMIRFMMVLFVLPPFVILTRRLHPAPGMRLVSAAFYCIFASYLFNVLEDLVLKDLSVTLLLWSIGAAGVLSFLGVLAMWRDARAERRTT
jgi:hypothetical protein